MLHKPVKGWAAAASAAMLVASPALGETDLASERRAIESFQAFDQRLQDIGWSLAHGNAEYCSNAIPAIGLQLQDMASYGGPEIARAALGLEGDFAVQTAARGSPSGRSPAFAANREVVALAGTDPNAWPAGERSHWQRLLTAHDHVDAVLVAEGSLTVSFADGEQATLTPVSACATRFELAGDTGRALADGNRVVIGVRFPGFELDDDLFAAAIAHELAHNLLEHPAWLNEHGRKRRNVRLAEREADRLMPWLLANAGYDPAAAERFFAAYKPNSGSFLFFEGSHDRWKDRAQASAAELPRIRALMESEGAADWSRHFIRDIDPARPAPR